MHTHIYPSVRDLTAALAAWISQLISTTLQQKELFAICLSGGNTPKALYEVLATEYKDKIDWERVHFFWGDERFVPFDDERNNAAMAYKSLLNIIPISDEHINVIRTDVPVQESIKRYVRLLDLYFKSKPKTFDLVLLGMGEDGHTLSLFPGYREQNQPEQWVIEAEKDGTPRISLTPVLVNRAAAIAFIVTGEGKAETLHNVLLGPRKLVEYPSQRIKPAHGRLHWFLDAGAAKLLQSEHEEPA